MFPFMDFGEMELYVIQNMLDISNSWVDFNLNIKIGRMI